MHRHEKITYEFVKVKFVVQPMMIPLDNPKESNARNFQATESFCNSHPKASPLPMIS